MAMAYLRDTFGLMLRLRALVLGEKEKVANEIAVKIQFDFGGDNSSGELRRNSDVAKKTCFGKYVELVSRVN